MQLRKDIIALDKYKGNIKILYSMFKLLFKKW